MLKITLVRSVIGNKPVNRRTVQALGLRKTGRTVYREDTPSVRGMIRNVQHLLRVESVDSAPELRAKAPSMRAVVTPPETKPTVAKAAPVVHKPAPKKPTPKKPAAKKPAPKRPAEKKPAPRKADTDRKAFGELGKGTKPGSKKKES